MPNINRIRVNNVKYNFGTQSYDDFIMKMYGRNTLYDLANGGGKSVLMLLLMQCVIPNSTLDDKQPIEKLFRGNDNTCIHSLIEWKLDDCDITEGLRYMTTGFAAKKAGGGKDADQVTIEGVQTEEVSADDEKTTAEIEYFNYCIFYRDYNKNDIINLPLIKGEERITYKGLKNYLLDLARTDKNIIVKVFDRKGEYQRFIADYGLYESQWELIRGINRTEGHVRTYFETNFRTTRKVIEDLLIEEIIEKAYAVKTAAASGNAGNTASLLMTIQEELKTLAEKKKRIADYDHEKELVQLLADRIGTFEELFREKEKTARGFAAIYRTIETEKKNADEELAKLEKELEELSNGSDRINHEIQQLKIEITKKERDEAEKRAALLGEELEKIEALISDRRKDFNERIAAGEYIDLLDAREKLAVLENERRVAENAQDGKVDKGCIAYNIRLRMEEKAAEITGKEQKISNHIHKLSEERDSIERLRDAAVQNLAVIESKLQDRDEKFAECRRKTEELGEGLSERKLLPPRELLDEASRKKVKTKEDIERLTVEESRVSAELQQLTQEKNQLEQKEAILKENEAGFKLNIDKQREEAGRLKSLAGIYGMNDDYSGDSKSVEKLAELIQSAIRKDYIRVHETGKAAELSEKRLKDIEMGVVLKRSEDIEKVREYIITRHSHSAITGIDYLSALGSEKRAELLKVNPSLPYGIVVEDLAAVTDDPGLREIETSTEVMLYDKENLDSAHNIIGENVFAVRRGSDYFTDEETVIRLKNLETENLRNLNEEKRAVQDMLATKQADLAFTEIYIGKGYDTLEERIKENEKQLRAVDDSLLEAEERERRLLSEKEVFEGKLNSCEAELKLTDADIVILREMAEIAEEERHLTRDTAELKASKDSTEQALSSNEMKIRKISSEMTDLEAMNSQLRDERREMDFNWDKKYSVYYTDTVRPDLNMSLAELASLFDRQAADGEGEVFSREKEKLLRDTLSDSVRRLEKSIEDKEVEWARLEEKAKSGQLFKTPEQELGSIEADIMKLSEDYKVKAEQHSAVKTDFERITGKLEYAEKALHDKYGEDIELPQNLDHDKELLRRQQELTELESKISEADKKLKSFRRRVNDSEELMRYAGRITEKEAIDTSGAEMLGQDRDLRVMFDDLLLDYDRINKNIDRIKNDTLKVKMMVVDSLQTVGAFQLANSVRDEVELPSTRREADELLKKLNSEAELITLERERIETGLTSMEKLRESFIDQCIERCLDVKTELGKLQHLSEITLGDEDIEMIKLSIPYVKDEFMKDRMSDYIDRIVAELDKKASESERQKFLNQSLSMKKLFSVIVTDMNRIKLSLYKRERIKEQSRYLKYEEAVGSTGQSQGIYIQFLISVINYISGMYSSGDGQKRTKTLFIDNPFGAAKDIYIWEPIFRLLQENFVQLVVPTRGATPEITGRFDINYILGQQKTGKRSTTVVVNYSSKTDTEELEYIQLDYEQQTFDFV